MPSYCAINIDFDVMPDFRLVLSFVPDSLFKNIGYPPLKSDVITVENRPDLSTPVYCSETQNEHIIVSSDGNYPFQFAYQLAHELGHLSARSDLRHPRLDGMQWVEEVMCDLHSQIALQRLAAGRETLRTGAVSYLSDHQAKYPASGVNAEWLAENSEMLTASTALSAQGEQIATYLFENVEHQRALSDNRLLLALPVHVSLREMLDQWSVLSGPGQSVPDALLRLASGL